MIINQKILNKVIFLVANMFRIMLGIFLLSLNISSAEDKSKITSTPATSQSATAAPSGRPALTVQVVVPKSVQVPVRLAANGNLAAWQEASIGAELQGLRLIQVNADVGDRVRAGQVLAVFASDGIAADLAQAVAQLAEFEVAAKSASVDANRARQVQGSGAISEQQVSQLLQAESAAKARLETARTSVAVQQVRLNHTRVTAPDSGIISARNATIGGVGGSAELFRLIRQGRLEWRAELTSAELARVKVGAAVQVTTAAGAKLVGKVRVVSPVVDATTRNATVMVDLQIPTATAGLAKPGMFARGEFELGTSTAQTVPQSALVLRDGFAYVLTVGADSRVRLAKVQTGRNVGEQIEVIANLGAGLGADTRVVATGAAFLNDGDLVRVVTTPAAPAAAAAPAAPAIAKP